MSFARTDSGFTLIELLIVVSIITVLSGVLLPGFSTYLSNQGLRQAIEQVEDDLRTLQNKALSGDSALELVNGNSPLFWGVRFQQGQDRYQYFITDTNTSCYPTYYVAKGTSSVLPGDNVIRSATRCLFFSFKNSDVSMIPSGSIIVIVGPVSGTPCRRVQLNASGLLQVLTTVSCT